MYKVFSPSQGEPIFYASIYFQGVFWQRLIHVSTNGGWQFHFSKTCWRILIHLPVDLPILSAWIVGNKGYDEKLWRIFCTRTNEPKIQTNCSHQITKFDVKQKRMVFRDMGESHVGWSHILNSSFFVRCYLNTSSIYIYKYMCKCIIYLRLSPFMYMYIYNYIYICMYILFRSFIHKTTRVLVPAQLSAQFR